MAEQGELQEKLDATDGWEVERQVEIAMDALRCPPGDAAIDKLSGGEKRRVALCRLLLSKPDMLLLDAPNHNLAAVSLGCPSRLLPDNQSSLVPRQPPTSFPNH